MARLYANEKFPFPGVLALRDLGHDVHTTDDAGRSGRAVPDDEVLNHAIAERRAVLTLNRKHFVHLHRRRKNHLGIIVCSFDPDFARQAQRIHAAIAKIPDLAGELIRVNRDG